MSRKSDTINYREFNKLTDHSDTNHDPLPSQVLFDDENINQLEATLMGMEYDNEDLDELQDLDELEDEEENEAALELSGEEEDSEDMDADIDDEMDESAIYEGHPV
ncbi:MAG: hypothetical protein H7336_07875 [Bacteriovorax sp.]|nr:hypothetical protein [Bacteriovorax sp.]